jgi:hypothetical protein
VEEWAPAHQSDKNLEPFVEHLTSDYRTGFLPEVIPFKGQSPDAHTKHQPAA